MNICYLISNIEPSIGGTERVTISVSENLSNLGYHSFFIFTHADNPSISKESKLKINYDYSLESLKKSVTNFIEKKSIKVLIVVNRVFQTTKYQKLFKYLKDKTTVNIIASLHAAPDNWFNKDVWGTVLSKVYVKNKIKSWILRLNNSHIKRVQGTYSVVDKYLLLSKSYIEQFKRIYHTDDNGGKLIAIPNPFPFKDTNLNSVKEKIVLIVSRMQEDQKRIYASIKIWQLISSRHPDWQLLIVGDGPDLCIYKKKSKHISNITFVGHSNNVQDYYRRSVFFLMTSIWEGLPMTLIEAMHYGCIPIAFDNFAALHDLIDNEKTGYIIQDNNIQSFANCLERLMSDESLAKRIRQNILNIPNTFEMKNIISIWDIELKKMSKI